MNFRPLKKFLSRFIIRNFAKFSEGGRFFVSDNLIPHSSTESIVVQLLRMFVPEFKDEKKFYRNSCSMFLFPH